MFKKIIGILLTLIVICAIGCGIWYLCDKDGFINTWEKITNKQEQKEEIATPEEQILTIDTLNCIIK